MRIRRQHRGVRAAFLAAALAALPACILDVDKHDLMPPGDGGDADAVDFDFTRPDTDIPDIDISPDYSDCDVECPVSWYPACSGETVWCISPYRGIGDCCEAWLDCQAISTNVFPGLWPTAGPYNGSLPADFLTSISLPVITIVFSEYQGEPPGRIANISCFNSEGIKENLAGETHVIPSSFVCSGETCETYTKTAGCPLLDIGCACRLPYWCVDYSMNTP
jgi:hypothetical protein